MVRDVDDGIRGFQELESGDVVSCSDVLLSHAHWLKQIWCQMRLLFLVYMHVAMEDWLIRDSGKASSFSY